MESWRAYCLRYGEDWTYLKRTAMRSANVGIFMVYYVCLIIHYLSLLERGVRSEDGRWMDDKWPVRGLYTQVWLDLKKNVSTGAPVFMRFGTSFGPAAEHKRDAINICICDIMSASLWLIINKRKMLLVYLYVRNNCNILRVCKSKCAKNWYVSMQSSFDKGVGLQTNVSLLFAGWLVFALIVMAIDDCNRFQLHWIFIDLH